MSIVPEDMISLILSQLPVKSLLRFKCVSKQFCSIIDSHYFSQLHLRNFVKNDTELSFIIQYNKKIRSLNFAGSPTWQTRELDARFGFSTTKILGSSNGLICVLKSAMCCHYGPTLSIKLPRKYNNISPKLALWNPSTSNKFHILPTDPIKVGGLKWNNGFVHIQYAFGHDSVNNDYKVLRIVKVPEEFSGSITNLRIFSLKTNSWREIAAPCYTNDIICRQHVLFQESFHWLLREGHESKICAFDIQGEVFCILVPLPNLASQYDFNVNLGVLGQCLCLSSCSNIYCFDIWMMKEYGMKDSWVKLFSFRIKYHHLGIHIEHLVPLALYPKDVNHGDHQKVLLKINLPGDDEKLMWYDIKKKEPEIVTVPGTKKESKLYTHVGTLVSPFFNDGSKNNDQVHQECDSKTRDKNKRKRDEKAKNIH